MPGQAIAGKKEGMQDVDAAEIRKDEREDGGLFELANFGDEGAAVRSLLMIRRELKKVGEDRGPRDRMWKPQKKN